MNYFGSIFAMVVCITMSAYFSATETAFSSLNRTRLKVLADNGNKRAALALKLSGDYDRLISTILIGNNIVNIMVASIGTLLFVGIYGDMGATISTVVVTIVVLIFGEITPKSIAKDTPERFALFSAPFIHFWILVLTPLNFLFSQWKKFVSRFFKTNDDTKMSHEELLLLPFQNEKDLAQQYRQYQFPNPEAFHNHLQQAASDTVLLVFLLLLHCALFHKFHSRKALLPAAIPEVLLLR